MTLLMTRRAFLNLAALIIGAPSWLSLFAKRNGAIMNVRAANAGDIPRIVELCEADRRQYEVGHANFYAVAADYAQKKQAAVAHLLEGSETVALVHESKGDIDGLILGRLVNAPPVYDPGGKVCLIEDFLVADPASWRHMGGALAAAANERIRQLGGVLLVAESMRAAKAKRNLLFSTGYSVATDWYCRDIDLAAPKKGFEGAIEPAVMDDVPAMVDLCERRRIQHQQYQPIFWRKASDSAQKQRDYLAWTIAQQKAIVLVHRTGPTMDGFIVADPFAVSPFFDRKGSSCNVDDFTVAEDRQWPVGAWLLCKAAAIAKSKGAVCTQVVCPDAELSKRRMLEQMGYRIGHEWFVRTATI